MAPRSPKPAAEGSTPSGPANAPGTQFGHQHLDNRIGTSLYVGRSRHGAQQSVKTAVDRHRGFDSLPAHSSASLLTGREPGPYPGRDRVRVPGRARNAVVAQPAGSTRLSGGRSGVRVPSAALVDVVEWRRRRSTKRECRFDPCRRHSTRRSSAGTERRPPKAEAARSNRAGETREAHLPPRKRHGRDSAR